jgi:hypothetical protein
MPVRGWGIAQAVLTGVVVCSTAALVTAVAGAIFGEAVFGTVLQAVLFSAVSFAAGIAIVAVISRLWSRAARVA